jgi:hypothetical protein
MALKLPAGLGELLCLGEPRIAKVLACVVRHSDKGEKANAEVMIQGTPASTEKTAKMCMKKKRKRFFSFLFCISKKKRVSQLLNNFHWLPQLQINHGG